MKTVTLTCEYCMREFTRCAAEHKRNSKIGRKVFCSRSCMCSYHNKNCPAMKYDHTECAYGSVTDEFTPFRKFLKSVRRRHKWRKIESNIALQDVKDQWESQNGICPYTGWQLHLPLSVEKWDLNMPRHLRASLDRIDCNEGYVRGNIQFVCIMANLAKHTSTSEMLVEFCAAVSKHNS